MYVNIMQCMYDILIMKCINEIYASKWNEGEMTEISWKWMKWNMKISNEMKRKENKMKMKMKREKREKWNEREANYDINIYREEMKKMKWNINI